MVSKRPNTSLPLEMEFQTSTGGQVIVRPIPTGLAIHLRMPPDVLATLLNALTQVQHSQQCDSATMSFEGMVPGMSPAMAVTFEFVFERLPEGKPQQKHSSRAN